MDPASTILRLRLLVAAGKRAHRPVASPPNWDLSLVQARCLCWLALLSEAHEIRPKRPSVMATWGRAMGWFADRRLPRTSLLVVSRYEILCQPPRSKTPTTVEEERVEPILSWSGLIRESRTHAMMETRRK